MQKRLHPEKEDEELTEKQQRIIEIAIEHPDWTYPEIADEADSSDGYVGKIHREYIEETIVPENVDWDDVDEDLYEMIVAGLEAREDVVDVEHRYDLPLSQGDSKEVDVAVWTESTRGEVLTIIECKFHEDSIEQEVVSEVIRNVGNSAANMAYIISKGGFQEGGISQAEDAGIGLFTLKRLEDGDAEGYIQNIELTIDVGTPSVRVHGISVSPVVDPPNMSPGVHSREITNHELREKRLWETDYTITDRNFSDLLGDLCSSRSVGVYQESIDDVLISVDGMFCQIDALRFECLPDDETTPMEHTIDMFEEYDLVMIDELADEEDDREFYSLEEALTHFVDEVSS
jgi:hypothetical protein